MSYDITQKVKVTNPASNVDWYYGGENGFWDSIEDACANVPEELRQIGKTVAIFDASSNGVVEYWWKAGIKDEDLIVKTGLTNSSINETTYIGTFVNSEHLTSVTIPKRLHKKGEYPIVQCYVNNILTLLDIKNNKGDITISWGQEHDLGEFDVLNIYIISSVSIFTYKDHTINSFTVEASEHGCGTYPIVQTYYNDTVENVLIDTVSNDGDITFSFGEGTLVEESDQIVAVFARGIYTSGEIINEEQANDYYISKKDSLIGKAPIICCYSNNELILADITNSDDDIIIKWNHQDEVSSDEPLVIVIGGDLEQITQQADELAKVAWSGSYEDLLDKPLYVANYTNPNGKKTLLIPAAKHNCGSKLMVQCKINNDLVLMDTSVNEAGDVRVSWCSPSVVSEHNILSVYIFGFKTIAKNVDEQKVVIDHGTILDPSSAESNPETPEYIDPDPINIENKVKVTLNIDDSYSRETVAVFVQYFEPNSRISLTDFTAWNEHYADKYENNGWYIEIGNEEVNESATLIGKEYTLLYNLEITGLATGTTTYEQGEIQNVRYNVPMSLSNIVYHNYVTNEDETINYWDNPRNIGELRDNSLYIMNGEYANTITLTGYVNASEM